jgi:SAM-dependent methyltransferase
MMSRMKSPVTTPEATKAGFANVLRYDWKDAGEEWSQPWGTSDAQWSDSILPRIRDCLPRNTIVEIGCGFGRWSHYLRDYCQQLWAVDRAAGCIEACRRRFAADPRLKYYLNDGRSLSFLPDESVDFVFSFDSLVHVPREIVDDYLRELRAKLKIGGKGFFHHSNLGAYANSAREHLPASVRRFLRKLKVFDWEHHRNPNMSAESFRHLCAANGIHCCKQELINWRGRRLIDCLSWFERSDSQEQTKIVRNPRFMHEAAAIRRTTKAAGSNKFSIDTISCLN